MTDCWMQQQRSVFCAFTPSGLQRWLPGELFLPFLFIAFSDTTTNSRVDTFSITQPSLISQSSCHHSSRLGSVSGGGSRTGICVDLIGVTGGDWRLDDNEPGPSAWKTSRLNIGDECSAVGVEVVVVVVDVRRGDFAPSNG